MMRRHTINRSKMTNGILLSLFLSTNLTFAFIPLQSSSTTKYNSPSITTASSKQILQRPVSSSPSTSSPTSLNVWWFGGTEQTEPNNNDDSCELVAVRIEKTSANSRRIAGEISVPATIDEVWSILTDYDRLAIHVPNLKESKIVQRQSDGRNGDGKFKCRLYQKGAQKIIGFDFSASVTMDMTEQIVSAANDASSVPQIRKIGFKCVDSQFFNNFDGDWTVKEQINVNGEVETVCSYAVDVRPKGPVPVAALEWRIREDVPTNLRAVKAAALLLSRPKKIDTPALARAYADRNGAAVGPPQSVSRLVPAATMMDWDWDRDETMAKYL